MKNFMETNISNSGNNSFQKAGEPKISPEKQEMLDIFVRDFIGKINSLIYKKMDVNQQNEELDNFSEWVDRAMGMRMKFMDRNKLYQILADAVDKKFGISDKEASSQTLTEMSTRAKMIWSYISKKSFTINIL